MTATEPNVVLQLQIYAATAEHPWKAVLTQGDAQLCFDSPLELAQHLASLAAREKRRGLK
jgi:hypothetical protein